MKAHILIFAEPSQENPGPKAFLSPRDKFVSGGPDPPTQAPPPIANFQCDTACNHQQVLTHTEDDTRD